MGHKDSCHTKFSMQVLNQVLKLTSADGIQGRKGLIHQQDLGMGNDGPQNPNPLPLSARQVLGQPVQVLVRLQAHLGQEFSGFFQNRCLIHTLHLRNKGNVLCHGHIGKEGDLLEDIACLQTQFPKVIVLEPLALKENIAVCLFQEAVNQFQGRCFSTTAGTNHHKELPLLDGKGQIAQDWSIDRAI